MWESLLNISHGRISLRRLSLFATASLMAFFLAIFLPLGTVFAAEAQRNGTTVSYNGNLYTKLDPTASPPQLPPGLPVGTDGYVFFDTTTNKAYFLLTSGPADQATSAEATTYDMTTVGSYGNHSPPQTVTIVTPPNNLTAAAQGNTGTTCNSDQTAGVGWIICPVVNFLAKGMDYIYKIISNFLVVRTVTTDTTSSLYRMWAIVRDIANICFVGAFLIIIYSQITEIGFSNYNLKKMLPRLVVGAILVNLSFWVCALAVDASNVIGYSIHDIFTNLMTNLNTAGQYGGAASVEPPSWAGLAAGVLAGTGVVAGAAIAIDTGAIFVLIPAVVMAMLSAVIALIILAARQALIVCLVIISPLAFVAYLLPNTEKWFDKWRSGLLTLLFLFPIFSVIFSGAQLAGLAIIQSANGNIITIILGMVVQVAPLFITPILLKFSGGILNRVGGLVNNPNKGVVDRTRKWAQGEREHRRKQYLTASDQHLSRNPRNWNPRAYGRSADRRRRRRALQDKESDALLESRAESDYNRRVHDGEGRTYQNQRHKNTRSHEHHATAKTHKESMEAQDEEHWQNHLYGAHGARLRTINQASHIARGRAGVTEEAMKAASERALQNSVNVDAAIRARKVQGTVDSGVAKLTADSIDASGQHRLQTEIMTSPTLNNLQRNMRVVQGSTKVIEESMQSADDRVVQNHISTSATLSNMKRQSIVDAGVAKMTSDNLEAYGKLQLQNTVLGDRNLRTLRVDTHEQNKRAEVVEGLLQSRADAHWGHLQIRDVGINQQMRDSAINKGAAKVMEDAAQATHERANQENIQRSPSLTRLRERTTVDSGVAKANSDYVDARGNERLQEAIKNDATLSGMVSNTYAHSKRAEASKTIVDKNAEESWNSLSRNDASTQELRLQSTLAEDTARESEEKWKTFVENARAKGSSAPGLAPSTTSTADQLMAAHEALQVESMAQESAKRVQQQNLANELKSNTALQSEAAGVGGPHAVARVVARAKSSVSKEMMEDIDNIQNTIDYDLSKNNKELRKKIDATSNIAEKIAFARAMSKNGGPGMKEFRQLLREYKESSAPGHSKDDLDTFKEVLASDSGIMSSGKDIEFYLTKSAYSDSDGDFTDAAGRKLPPGAAPIYKDFDEISNDKWTWLNMSANAFASQNIETQKHGLTFLYTHHRSDYMDTINNIRNNPNAKASLKQGLVQQFSIYSDEEIRENPHLPTPGTKTR